jgi:hypothetical protein
MGRFLGRAVDALCTRKGVVAALFALWLVHLFGNAVHIAVDDRGTQLVDSANQLDFVYQYPAGLHHAGLAALWQEMRSTGEQWPPLVHVVLGTLAALINPSLPAVRLYNLVFLAVLIVGAYRLGSRAAGPRAGLLAATLCSFLPALYGLSRQVGLDFPAAAMVVLGVDALVATEGFRRRRAALVAGVVIALAVLTRGQCLFFLVGVGLLELVRGRRQPGAALVNAALCLAIVAAISAVWWWGRLEHLFATIQVHGDARRLPLEGDPTLLGGVWLYLGGLYLLTSAPLLALLAPLAAHGVVRCRKVRWVLLAWLSVPLLIHLLLAVRNLRYLVPLLPALAIGATVGVLELRRAWVRRAGVAALLVLSLGLWCLCPADPDDAHVEACCGHAGLNRTAGPDGVAGAARRLAARLGPRPGGSGPAVLMLAYRDRFGPLIETAAHIRSALPHLVLHTPVRGQPGWQQLATWRARARFLLTASKERPPEPLRRLATVSFQQNGRRETLHLWQLSPDSDWVAPR